MSAFDLWFSDSTDVPKPLPYCLVCWGYGRFQINHSAGEVLR